MGDTVQAGEVIGRRYTLIRTLGIGGSARCGSPTMRT